MIPGPTPVVESIRREMGREIQAFGDPRFVKDYAELIQGLGQLMGCDGQAFPLAGSGTLAMEMAVANSVQAGDQVLIVSHGFFGDRFIEICQAKGLEAHVLASEWGQAVSLDVIKEALDRQSYKAVFVTHVDTSTGVRAAIGPIGELIKAYPDTLYVLDGVAATGGEYTHMTDMNIDILFTGSQKAFGVSPGIFVLWANQKALARREALGRIPEYYVDYQRWLPVMADPSRYFATPAVNLVWAMKRAMELMREEGMKERAQRHHRYGRAMQMAFEAMGFTLLAEEGQRATTLSCLIYPPGVKDLEFRSLVSDAGAVIAGALGDYAGKACRVGHMGNIDEATLLALLAKMERALMICGLELEAGQGMAAFLEASA